MNPIYAAILSILMPLHAHEPPADGPGEPLSHSAVSIDGETIDLSQYEGRPVLVVNVASKCGLTPQYEGLEALHQEFKDDGLVILAFPCNQFLGQEPGTNDEIAAFCRTTFDVSFPMFEKIDVKGEDAHPVFRVLGSTPTTRIGPGEKTQEGATGDPEWNFTKFLLSRDGALMVRFHPTIKPQDPRLVQSVRDALAREG